MNPTHRTTSHATTAAQSLKICDDDSADAVHERNAQLIRLCQQFDIRDGDPDALASWTPSASFGSTRYPCRHENAGGASGNSPAFAYLTIHPLEQARVRVLAAAQHATDNSILPDVGKVRWQSGHGEILPVSAMSPQHLINAMEYCRRNHSYRTLLLLTIEQRYRALREESVAEDARKQPPTADVPMQLNVSSPPLRRRLIKKKRSDS